MSDLHKCKVQEEEVDMYIFIEIIWTFGEFLKYGRHTLVREILCIWKVLELNWT